MRCVFSFHFLLLRVFERCRGFLNARVSAFLPRRRRRRVRVRDETQKNRRRKGRMALFALHSFFFFLRRGVIGEGRERERAPFGRDRVSVFVRFFFPSSSFSPEQRRRKKYSKSLSHGAPLHVTHSFVILSTRTHTHTAVNERIVG